MELTIARCSQILDTLPVGYYAGRRISVTLDDKEETSFYSPVEDTIVVSYPIIAQRMKNLPDTADQEEAVRSMLYHEVSHAILTPKSVEATVDLNIFEDERIESLLQNYYHNVNFKKQLYDIHGGEIPNATTPEQAFFNAVRFGLGTADIQERIHKVMNDYSDINRLSDYYDSSNYQWDVRQLYNHITREFQEHPEDFQPPQANGGQSKNMDGLKQEQDQSGKSKNGSEENNDFEKSENRVVSNQRIDKPLTAEEVKAMAGQCLANKPKLLPEDLQKLNEFQKTIETIIGNFNKKNSGGSGINSYSGVFNPRAVVRKDYRFFERSMSTQGNNRFGTCHLNLIIDCSGSYSPNVKLTNAILCVLTEIERKNRNFTMDVAFINHEFHICESVRDRVMTAWGGNSIPEDMKQILLKMQKPQTCNYNIVLFDGDAMSNQYFSSKKKYTQLFSAFDMKQTTLITDPDNKSYSDNFTSTKVVVTRNYTSELINHITRALSIAFG